MRLALLVGANPSTFKDSPVLRIPRGFWAIKSSGVANSKLLLKFSSPTPAEFELDKTVHVKLVNPGIATIEFAERGQEKYISVFAESLE